MCRAILTTAALAAFTFNALAQNTSYEPYEGQSGKDVVWVPTPPALVETMLDAVKVTPRDYVVDLGSGDGRMVIAAAKRGARALGVEYEAPMVALARKSAAAAGVGERARFVQGDMYEADFSKATVLALFLLTQNLDRLEPKFRQLQPGTRIINNGYRITGWEEETVITAEGNCGTWCTAYLYLVPAKVAGDWQLPAGMLRLTQNVQLLGGVLRTADGAELAVQGRVRGEIVQFKAGGDVYTGRVQGALLRGEASGAFSGHWTATRLR